MSNRTPRPQVTITLEGTVQSGKSIIMDRIARVLEEYGAEVHSEELQSERGLQNFDRIDDWEREMIRETKWHLVEKTEKPTPPKET